MKNPLIKDPYAAQRAEIAYKKKVGEQYIKELDKRMLEFGYTRFTPPTAQDFFTPDKVKELTADILSQVTLPKPDSVDYNSVFTYVEDYIQKVVRALPPAKDGKTPTKAELEALLKPFIPAPLPAEKVDYSKVEETVKTVLDKLPSKKYVIDRTQVIDLVKELIAKSAPARAVQQFIGSVASIRQLTDVDSSRVPTDSRGNFILNRYNLTVSATAPQSPQVNDLWVDIT